MSTTKPLTLVQIDLIAKKVNLLDPAGHVQKSFDQPGSESTISPQSLDSGKVAIFTSSDNGRVFVLSLADGVVHTITPVDGLRIAMGQPLIGGHYVRYDGVTDGDVFVVDLSSGVGTSLSKRLGGTHKFVLKSLVNGNDVFADAVPGPATSMIMPLADPTKAWLVPGQVLTVNGERSVTVDGDNVAIYERDTLVGRTTLADAPIGAIDIDHQSLIAVTAGKLVLRVDVTSGVSTNVGSLDFVPTVGTPLGSSHLFVSGDVTSSALLDAAGRVVRSFPVVTTPEGGKKSLRAKTNGSADATCAGLHTGDELRPVDENAAVIDIASGTTKAKLHSTPIMLPTPDGCSATTPFDTIADAVLDGKLVSLNGYETVEAVAPDLRHVVVATHRRASSALVDVATNATVSVPSESLYEFAALS